MKSFLNTAYCRTFGKVVGDMGYYGRALTWHRIAVVCMVIVFSMMLTSFVYGIIHYKDSQVIISPVLFAMFSIGIVFCAWKRDSVHRSQEQMMNALKGKF